MKKKLTFLTALVGIMALALSAVAAPITNTALVHGYDDESLALIWGTSDLWEDGDTEGQLDCSLDGDYTYEADEEGAVTSLEDEEGAAEFGYEEDYVESDEGPDDGEETFEYGSEDAEECSLTSTNVEGPQGQVNHGTVVSSFVHALREQGIRGAGCLISVIAQSDYGKGDQQITTEEAAAAEESEAEESETTVTLETALAACTTGPEKAEEAKQKGQEAREAAWAARDARKEARDAAKAARDAEREARGKGGPPEGVGNGNGRP